MCAHEQASAFFLFKALYLSFFFENVWCADTCSAKFNAIVCAVVVYTVFSLFTYFQNKYIHFCINSSLAPFISKSDGELESHELCLSFWWYFLFSSSHSKRLLFLSSLGLHFIQTQQHIRRSAFEHGSCIIIIDHINNIMKKHFVFICFSHLLFLLLLFVHLFLYPASCLHYLAIRYPLLARKLDFRFIDAHASYKMSIDSKGDSRTTEKIQWIDKSSAIRL